MGHATQKMILILVVLLFLTGCRAVTPLLSDDPLATGKSKPLTTNTNSEIIVELARPTLQFSSLERYRETLQGFSDVQRLRQVFIEQAKSDRIYFREQQFEMLLQDTYFLVPELPKGWTLTGVTFASQGVSHFDVEFSDGSQVFFSCYHHKDGGTNAAADAQTFVNNRGITVAHEQKGKGGLYLWQEGEYPCQMMYTTPFNPAYTEFVKQLGFDKIQIQ